MIKNYEEARIEIPARMYVYISTQHQALLDLIYLFIYLLQFNGRKKFNAI